MSCGNCETPDPNACGCVFCDTDCLEVRGSGTSENGFQLFPKLSQDPRNMLSCETSPAGLLTRLPIDVEQPAAFRMTRDSNETDIFSTNRIDWPIRWNTVRFNARNQFTWLSGVGLMTPSTTQGKIAVVPISGVYLIDVMILWEGNDSGRRRLAVKVNNTFEILRVDERTEEDDPFAQHAMGLFPLRAGTHVSVHVQQNSGSTLEIIKVNSYSPEWSMVWMGPSVVTDEL